MGNKIQVDKVKTFIKEISECHETDDSLIRNEFTNLFQLTGVDIKTKAELTKVFKDILLSDEYNEESIIVITKNLVFFITMQLNEKTNMIKQSLDLLYAITEVIYDKFKNLREIILFSLNSFNINNFNNDNNTKLVIKSCFPFNILSICVEILVNEELFLNNDFFKTEYEKFEVTNKLTNILYNVIYFQKNNEMTTKHYVEYIDLFKISLSSELLFTKSQLTKLVKIFYLNVFINFPNFVSRKLDTHISYADFESFIVTNFYLLLWFCYDINRFFFSEVKKNFDCTSEVCPEFYFENEYNQKIFRFILKYLYNDEQSPIQIVEIIKNYNQLYREILSETFSSYGNLFKQFFFEFWNNYDSLSHHYKLSVKVFLIFAFELDMDLCEMICLSKEYLKLILSKLTFNDLFDLILLNKLTMCKNFYIIVKHIEADSSSYDQTKTQMLCDKCLETVLSNKKEHLRLDSISYFLLLIVYNLSCYLTEINQSILLKLGEFLVFFIDVELQADNFLDNLLVIKIYYDIVLNFLNNLETPNNLILTLAKFHEQIIQIEDKYSNYMNTNYQSDEKSQKYWCSFKEIHDQLMAKLEKIQNKINEEGANVKFTPNQELIKIINKISFDKTKTEDLPMKLKGNKIFSTDTEKFIILNINSFDNQRVRIMK